MHGAPAAVAQPPGHARKHQCAVREDVPALRHVEIEPVPAEGDGERGLRGSARARVRAGSGGAALGGRAQR